MAKDVVYRVKLTHGEKIFANHALDKELVVTSVELRCDAKKTHDPTIKWTQDLNRHFSKED